MKIEDNYKGKWLGIVTGGHNLVMETGAKNYLYHSHETLEVKQPYYLNSYKKCIMRIDIDRLKGELLTVEQFFEDLEKYKNATCFLRP